MRKVIRMNFETVMSFVGVVVAPLVAFIFKEVLGAKRELDAFKTKVAEEYAPRDEIKRIEDKLDTLYQLILDRLPKKGK